MVPGSLVIVSLKLCYGAWKLCYGARKLSYCDPEALLWCPGSFDMVSWKPCYGAWKVQWLAGDAAGHQAAESESKTVLFGGFGQFHWTLPLLLSIFR